MSGFEADLNFISDSLDLSAEDLRERFGGPLEVRSKADTSFVTNADLASEKIIIDRIRKYYPDDVILSEEAGLSSLERRPGSHIWVIDPLDGTTNFANNYPFFAVSIARGVFDVQQKIQIIAGGIAEPERKRHFTATLGGGAFCNGARISVSSQAHLEKAFLVTGFYYNQGEALTDDIRRFSQISSYCQSIRRDGAAALDLAYIAAGIFDGFWEIGLQPWDVAAGSLLVSEAGGKIYNYSGEVGTKFDVEAPGVIAGNFVIGDSLKGIICGKST